jgi:hypothetical protein
VKQLRSYLPNVVAAVGITTRIVPHQLRHYAAFRTMPRIEVLAANRRHASGIDAA